MLVLTNRNTDCSGIIVTSTTKAFDAGDIASIKIDSTVGCCDTVYTQTITDFVTPDSIFVDNDGTLEIHLLPTFYSQTGDTLADSVYKVTLTITNDDDSIIEEVGCIFIDCYLKCKIVELIEEGDYESHRIFEAIHSAIDCSETDCNCTAACSLYQTLVNKLPNTLNNDNINNCGCS